MLQQNVVINDIPQDIADYRLLDRITNTVPQWHQNIKVEGRHVTKDGAVVGREWIISFVGLREDIAQFYAQNIDIPLAEFKVETLLDYSPNMFLYPAPYSLFHTIHTSPQLTVKVDGQLGACNYAKAPQDDCDMEVDTPRAKVDSFKCDAPYDKLEIFGSDFDQVNIEWIKFAKSRCTNVQVKKNKITCELKDVTPGKYRPKIYVKGLGNLQVKKGSEIKVRRGMSFEPKVAYNKGGRRLIIHMDKLPPCTCKVKVFVGDMRCKRLRRVRRKRKNLSQLRCRMPRIKEPGMYDVRVEVDGVDSNLGQIEVKQLQSKTKLERKSRKSSTRGDFNFRCGGGLPDLSRDELKKFRAYFTNGKRRVRMRTKRCRWNAETQENEITTYYPGGCGRGKWKLVVEHEGYGEITQGDEEIEMGITISDFSPKPLHGSLEGGTELTLTGENFEEGMSVLIGKQKCVIKEITDTTITIETPPSPRRDKKGNYKNAKDELFVVDADGEIIRFESDSNPIFHWKFDETPEILATTVKDGVMTCMGRGFPSDMNEIEVRIAGRKQKMERVFNKNQFSCKLTDLEYDDKEMDIEVRTRKGGRCRMKREVRRMRAPKPKFRGISRGRCSRRGTELEVDGSQFTRDMDYIMINDSGREICRLRYVNGEKMRCRTKRGSFNRRRCRIRRRVRKENDPDIECQGENCDFETTEEETPKVTSCTPAGREGRKRKFRIRGKRFRGGCRRVRIGRKRATKITVISEEEIEAEFDDGVGFPQGEQPEVEMETGGLCEVDPEVDVTEPIPDPDPEKNIRSSLLGGADYHFKCTDCGTGSNLAVEVCGFKCPRLPEKETDNELVCALPEILSTSFVEKHEDSAPTTNLYNLPSVDAYSPNMDYALRAFDNSVTSSYGTDDLCYLGIRISTFQRMTLEKIKFFLNPQADKKQYIGGTFRASLDGVSWTTIHTITELPTNGWNVVDSNCGPMAFAKYRFLKYQPAPTFLKACDFAELNFLGKAMFVEPRDEFPCNVAVYETTENEEGVESNKLLEKYENAVTYAYDTTPQVTGVSHRYISWRGGERIVISGTGFGSDPEKVSVMIDGKVCTVEVVALTEIHCVTAERKELVEPTLDILIAGKGYAQNNGLQIKYVCRFSDELCWGDTEKPGPGDSMFIPAGYNLLVDEDEVPNLDELEENDDGVEEKPYLTAVIIEGCLIFEGVPQEADSPIHERIFHAGYIIAREGCIEIGTKEKPYESKLDIVLHGAKEDPQLPLFGNKMIGVWEGKLDIHGKERSHTWVEMAETAQKGANEIVLNVQAKALDWMVGEEIVIASSGFASDEAEHFKIEAITQTPDEREFAILKLDGVLENLHYAGSKNYGTIGKPNELAMRAEVGLLTRNIVIRSDDDGISKKYGGHIMLKGDSVEGRISYVEMRNMGQAFQVDRHPVTFTESEHLGKSYISHNSIWDGYNRAVAIHASHCLRVEGNVAYNVMGHNFFIEDGVETQNTFRRNLAVQTIDSQSLLNTDQTPASFWITNPNNYLEHNHAAGSPMYGFWFDLHATPSGASLGANICPQGVKLGKFNGNVAHSNGRYGLRLFEEHTPRTYPCDPVLVEPVEGSSNPEQEAFQPNPPIPAVYENFVGYKNMRSAIITERIGAVQFKGIKTADNIEEGIEISLPGYCPMGQGFIDDALIVGTTENAGDLALYEQTKGITTGQRDSFYYKNIMFSDFSIPDNDQVAAIGTCSHCSKSLDIKGFVNTHVMSGLTFNNVERKILYHKLKKTIVHNPDGTIRGDGVDVYMTSSLPHLLDRKFICQDDVTLDDSVVCTKPIRKVLINKIQPVTELSGQKIRILLEDDYQDLMTNTPLAKEKPETALLPNLAMAGQWEFPVLMGESYSLKWLDEIDVSAFNMERSRLYKAEDGDVLMHFRHVDRRDEFTVKSRGRELDKNSESLLGTGKRFGNHYHDTANQDWEVVLNAQPDDKGLGQDCAIAMTSLRCLDGCEPNEGLGTLEDRVRFWSKPKDWKDNPDDPNEPMGVVPREGESPIVKRGWNMYYDVRPGDPDWVELQQVTIYGRLTWWDPEIPVGEGPQTFEMKTHILAIELGEIFIGIPERPALEDKPAMPAEPYQNEAIITLLGN